MIRLLRIVLFVLIVLFSGACMNIENDSNDQTGDEHNENTATRNGSGDQTEGHSSELYVFQRTNIVSETAEIVEDIYNNRLYLHHFWEPYEYEGELRWDADPYEDTSWQFYLHGLRHVSYLVNGYELQGDVRYLEKAMTYIESWITHNSDIYDAANEMAWHDHGTANRAVTMMYFWTHWKHSELYDPAFERMLIDSFAQHAEFLADPEHYSPYNHGVFQDRALLQMSVLFEDEWDGSDEWRAIAKERLQQRLDEDVSAEGVHLEHSPYYHMLFMELMLEVREFVDFYDLQFPDLDETVDAMQDYMAYMTLPDGSIPTIGDSRAFRFQSRYEQEHVTDALWYVMSGGQDGEQPPLRDVVYPEAGIAIFRSTWEFTNPIQMQFQAGYHSQIHKHADDLAFIISHGDTNYFVDSGFYNYDQDSPYRQYLTSVFAHNTIAVDNESYALHQSQIGKSGIETYRIDEEASYVVASHDLYDGVHIRRTLIHVHPGAFFVHDQIEAADTHEYRQMFNIGGNVRLEHVGSDGMRLSSELDHSVLELRQLIQADDVDHYDGHTEPMRGFQSKQFEEVEPIPAVHFKRTGQNVEFQTLIHVGDGDARVRDVRINGNEYMFDMHNGEEKTVTIHSLPR